jgi:hypothetical protein
MSHWYWISVIVSVIAFGGMSGAGRYYTKLDGIWVPLYITAYIFAIYLSGSVKIIVATATLLFFGNGLFWGFVWGFPQGVLTGHKIRQIIKEHDEKEK